MIYIILLAIIALPVIAVADDDGGTESAFNLGAGARAMGMGNGYTALAEDATAIYYNPAGMPYLQSQQISFLHTALFEGTIYDYLSYVYPFSGAGSFGIAGMRLGTDDIGRRDAVSDLGRFSSARMQFLLSYAQRFGNRYSAGVNIKLVHHSIADYGAYGYGFDLAGRATITEHLRAGILLQDLIGARVKLATVTERTPFTFRAGLAYLIQPDDSPFSGTLVFDIDKPEHRNVKVRTGFEVSHSSGLSLRTGYDRDNVTMGLGIRYHQLTFDYAYKFMDHLSDSHRFSLSFDFGATRQERQARQTEEVMRNRDVYIQADRRASLLREMEKADEYFNAGELDSAMAAYYRADAFADAESSRHIEARLAAIRLLQADRLPDGVTDARTAEIVREATDLMHKGELKAARDVVDAAINSKIDAAELYVLRREIDFRIEDEIESHLKQAEQAYDQGNYIEAYNYYNQVLNLDVNNQQAREESKAAKKQIDIAQHLKLAMDYYEEERYILSQREFNSVLNLDADNETALRYIRLIEDRLRESGTQAEKDLRQDQEMWQVYLDGVEAYRAGDYEKAIELWNRVLKKYPSDKMTLENKRQAQLRLED
jgi:tetratricopeptide (TPR) repeat protein